MCLGKRLRVACVLAFPSVVSVGYAVPSPMAGLVSPRPLSYNNYNPYARNVPPPYPESPASVGPMAIHTPGQGVGGYPGASPAIPTVAHEEQKVYGLVIDLLNPEKREGALLELSKKREQYDDLALVLWHSFGTCRLRSRDHLALIVLYRHHAGFAPGDCLRVPSAVASQPHGTRVQPRLQRPRASSMRGVSS